MWEKWWSWRQNSCALNFSLRKVTDVRIEVTDALARTVFAKALKTGSGGNTIEIDFVKQDNGIYFINVSRQRLHEVG